MTQVNQETLETFTELVREGNIAIKTRAILASSSSTSKQILNRLFKMSFRNEITLHDHLLRRNVYCFSTGNVPVCNNFHTLNDELQLSLDLKPTPYVYNKVIIVMEVFGRLHIFDIKDIDPIQVHDMDGVEYKYAV